MKRIFKMYGGLRREIYIICFGRFVTAMGSLIWPMLTLILKSKLNFDAEQVAFWFLLFGILQIPFGLAGGKLTDKYNKRNLILFFDLISVALYILTACLPLTTTSLCIYFIGSLFQHMEWPAYDALIAEMTVDKEREKAYSLQYLASNLGVVFAPTLGGLLFNNYLWLSFIIAGMAVLSSTILIFLFIPKTVERAKNNNMYEAHEDGSLLDVINSRKILLVYVVIGCVAMMLYSQFNYLLPMQMDEMFSERGAMLFGMLTSINGAVVIIFTPIFTQLTLHWRDYERVFWGIVIQSFAICTCVFYTNQFVFYVVTLIVFTWGEILHTLGASPYLSKRIPASHRGRFVSINNICMTMTSSGGNTLVGKVFMAYSFKGAWTFVFIISAVLTGVMVWYRKLDKKKFALLYNRQ